MNISLKQHLCFGILVRFCLIFYSYVHDATFQVPYTDVDYKVFTDAARYVLHEGSPYERHTYRYTPLISWLLIPNLLFHDSFGKILFSLIDILASVLIKLIIKNIVLRSERNERNVESISNFGMSIWLYNPLTIAIATRGNSDSIAGFFVLLTLYLIQCKNWPFFTGLVHGLAIHIRIYPLIYSLALFLYLHEPVSQTVQKSNRNSKNKRYLTYLIPNLSQIKLILGTILSLSFLTGLFYYLYGYKFLFESYIYHLIRKDTRHNFSLYFYLQYISAGYKVTFWQKLLTNLPQLILFVVFSFKYGLNKLSLNFAVLILTCIFVTYNSVVTSQYFIWILAVLPLCVWQIRMNKTTVFLLGFFWILAQALWLLSAYLLEFQGLNMFLYVWINSVAFYCANIACIGKMIDHFTICCKDKKL